MPLMTWLHNVKVLQDVDDHHDDNRDHHAQHVAIMIKRTPTHQELLNMVEHQHLQ